MHAIYTLPTWARVDGWVGAAGLRVEYTNINKHGCRSSAAAGDVGGGRGNFVILKQQLNTGTSHRADFGGVGKKKFENRRKYYFSCGGLSGYGTARAILDNRRRLVYYNAHIIYYYYCYEIVTEM